MGIPQMGEMCQILIGVPARSIDVQLPLQDRTSAVIGGIAIASRQHHSQGGHGIGIPRRLCEDKRCAAIGIGYQASDEDNRV